MHSTDSAALYDFDCANPERRHYVAIGPMQSGKTRPAGAFWANAAASWTSSKKPAKEEGK